MVKCPICNASSLSLKDIKETLADFKKKAKDAIKDCTKKGVNEK